MFACIYGQNIKENLPLADFAYAFSPLVEETKPDTVVIDVEGCELLFGSAYDRMRPYMRPHSSKA